MYGTLFLDLERFFPLGMMVMISLLTEGCVPWSTKPTLSTMWANKNPKKPSMVLSAY